MIPVAEDVLEIAQQRLVSQYHDLPNLTSLMTSDARRVEINQVRGATSYQVIVDGVTYTYHAKTGETAEEIAYGLYLVLLGYGEGGSGFGFDEFGMEPFGGGV